MLTAESTTTITLTDAEWAAVIKLARARNDEAVSHHRHQTDGSNSKNALTNHIQGAGAELAVAKLYSLRWDATINGFRKIPDLVCCEIRSTRKERPYLRIKMTDKATKSGWPFILVTYLGGRTFQVEGWIYGYDGMREKYYVERDDYTGKPEWHAPISDLNAPFTLVAMLHKLRELTGRVI